MLPTNKHYLMFRGEHTGRCVITKVQLIGMEISRLGDNYPDTVSKFKIECESVDDALETVIKIRNCCICKSISWMTVNPNEFVVYYECPMDIDNETLKHIFRTDIFVLLDYVEGEFNNRSNLELLFEIQ